jgi:hypothetical protein
LKAINVYQLVVVGNFTKEIDRKELEEGLWAIVKRQADKASTSEGIKMPIHQEIYNTMQG